MIADIGRRLRSRRNQRPNGGHDRQAPSGMAEAELAGALHATGETESRRGGRGHAKSRADRKHSRIRSYGWRSTGLVSEFTTQPPHFISLVWLS